MDNIEKQIINEIDKRKDELIDYLGKLISFPSENEGVPGTGKETELQNYIYEDFLKSNFDKVGKIAASNDNQRPNIMHLAATDDWLSANPPEFIFPTIQHWGPFKTSIDHPGVKLIEEALRDVQQKQPIYSSFRAVCDATFLQQRGISSVVLGPGGLNMSVHGPNEFVPIDELLRCAKTYAVFAYRWCNKD